MKLATHVGVNNWIIVCFNVMGAGEAMVRARPIVLFVQWP